MEVFRAYAGGTRLSNPRCWLHRYAATQCNIVPSLAIYPLHNYPATHYTHSRWGRFQDVDERSAYYEYLLKRAGIRVHYCAEQFENDGTMSSSVLKTLKRSMAAEHSRERL
jgi:hypothetical protein